MSSKGKKGRNPVGVDNWLESIGLYRKNIAYDETCLFRAVSEQLFDCQIYHERVRRECVEYGRMSYFDFWNLLESEEEWYNHLHLLEKHMIVCGNIELQLVSYKYDCDIVVYDAVRQSIANVTRRNLDKTLTLCLMSEDHYDVVHKKEHIQNAGFCQSLVYRILYENIFKIPNVPQIVHGMLYDKEFVPVSFVDVSSNIDEKIKSEDVNDKNEVALPPPVNIAPFPFKVAKALDPTIYRNIEYDAWTEVRRELRLGDWYYGDDNLILGTRCVYNLNNETYECYIQEIIKDENKCVIYITKLAEKKTVNYTDLSPENDAKPWPLPYRFTKNLVVTPPQCSTPLKLPNKKRRDKRRVKSNSESQTTSQTEEVDQDIEAFIGVPLQMQNSSVQTCPQQETPPETSLSQHNLLVTPDIPSPVSKFSWETPWGNVSSGSSDNKFVWSQPLGTPPNAGNCNMKPMVASAPVTPNVVPYHDNQYPFMYNYQVDNYSSYNSSWNNNSTEYTTSESQYQIDSEESREKLENFQETPPQQVYTENYEPPPVKERPTLTLPIPNPQPVEVFSPVISIPPGTPVIYAHPQEVSDVVCPTQTFQVYTPPVDVQYVSPGPYFYSPTIPTTWYPVGINSQGFIFPTINQNLQSN